MRLKTHVDYNGLQCFLSAVQTMRNFGLSPKQIAELSDMSVRSFYRSIRGKRTLQFREVYGAQTAALALLSIQGIALKNFKYDVRKVQS